MPVACSERSSAFADIEPQPNLASVEANQRFHDSVGFKQSPSQSPFAWLLASISFLPSREALRFRVARNRTVSSNNRGCQRLFRPLRRLNNQMVMKTQTYEMYLKDFQIELAVQSDLGLKSPRFEKAVHLLPSISQFRRRLFWILLDFILPADMKGDISLNLPRFCERFFMPWIPGIDRNL